MITKRDEFNKEVGYLFEWFIERLELLLAYEDENYPRERVFEEIRSLLDDIG